MVELLVWAVCLPFVLSLPFVALSYAFFWYETVNGPHRSMLSQLSDGHPGRWTLRGVVSGTLAVAVVIVTFPMGWLYRKDEVSDPPGSRSPVLLTHGLYHNASAWLLYRRRLRRAGYSCVETFQYSSWGIAFDDLTRGLADRVDGLFSRFGKPVILIGHSLGGVLSRACAQDPTNAGKIAAVVTLGSPHQGSKLAALALGRLGRSLVFRGPLIAALESRAMAHSIARLAVVSPVDNMVLPNEALKVPGDQWEYHQTPPISHVSMLYHLPTLDAVLKFLPKSK